MSCFPRRHVGPTFNHERYSEIEEEANLDFGYDQASFESETRLTSMVLGLFKTARIAVIKRVVSSGKTLLNRMTSRRSNDDTPSESVQKERKSYIPATETVTFPSLMVSTTAPQDVRSSKSSALVPSLDQLGSTDPSLRFDDAIPFLRTRLSPVNTEEDSEFRVYKEKSSSKLSFPEIEKGIVSIRARWLESLLADRKSHQNSTILESVLEMPFSRYNSQAKPPALGALGGVERMTFIEKLLVVSEPYKEDDFEDSPRLHKHRMPEDEPKPWVEQGTVARGALWLEQILSGRERRVGIPFGVTPKCENKPTSPTGVVEANFFY